ncbi:MAG: hypothetical protein H7338_17735 [Candidatus Sericytochromatia bacterium]|nr:hypothetical protein [Candidatus Sericytochromatia bacterium]
MSDSIGLAVAMLVLGSFAMAWRMAGRSLWHSACCSTVWAKPGPLT